MKRAELHKKGSFLLAGADLLSGGVERQGAAVLVAGGRVEAVGPAAEKAARRRRLPRLDLSGHYLAPGFVDLHTHGAAGIDLVRATRAEFERAMRHYLAHGVTSLLVSVYPLAPAEEREVLGRLASHIAAGVGGGVAVGIHLEGPFLSPARPGALPARWFRKPGAAALARLLDACGGLVRTMTVAPELPGGAALLGALRRRGIVPAFGHSDADYDGALRAMRSGVRYVTHLFNAMRGIHHRAPGPAVALLEDPRVAVELIADGFHVSAPVLRLVHAVKPRDRVILVSDSVPACGLREGRYDFAGTPVKLRGGRVTLLDGTLAGSALTLERALALHVEEVGLSPAEAVLCVTRNPARAVGLERRRGEVAPGKRADLVLLDRRMRVRATWLAGEPVYSTRSSAAKS